MYAVIMAGGGGTRLHPLSRPERPKPFLPLLGERTLLQATAARLPTDDVTVVTDRRYERFVRDQLPDAGDPGRADGPQHRRRPSPWPRSPSTGPPTRSCSSCPADAHIDPAREDVYRDVLRHGRRAPGDRRVRYRRARS